MTDTPPGYHRHPNGGGLVADTASVADTAYVGPDALVCGRAQVYGRAQVSGHAQVYGNAQVSGDAWVSGRAQVSGHAQVYGNAQVYGDAWVFGSARVQTRRDIAWGRLRRGWTAYRTADGSWTLQYGCETHPLDRWPHKRLAEKHAPDPDSYAAETRALAAMVRAYIRAAGGDR